MESFPASMSRATRMFTPRSSLLRVLRAVVLPDRTAFRAVLLRGVLLRAALLRAGPLRAAPFRAGLLRFALLPAPLPRVSPVRRAAPLGRRAAFLACFV